MSIYRKEGCWVTNLQIFSQKTAKMLSLKVFCTYNNECQYEGRLHETSIGMAYFQ